MVDKHVDRFGVRSYDLFVINRFYFGVVAEVPLVESFGKGHVMPAFQRPALVQY